MQVHFIRSVQRVAKKLNGQNKENTELFINIGQKILKAKSAAEVMKLFQSLKGDCPPITDAKQPSSRKIVKEWTKATAWVEWWTRKHHLSKQSEIHSIFVTNILCVIKFHCRHAQSSFFNHA